ncbi:MAG: hypothetical protein NEA02_00860 [Thermoanaerobaculia bacterium]|nr:hypothetical protein [Thermoanaerobaculia bacterium]
MLTVLVLLAQVSAAPAPTPAVEPVIAASSGRTRTLADVARERKLGKKGVQGGTLSVAGAPISAADVAAARRSAATVDAEEAAWRTRNAQARGELAQAQATLEQANASLPSWSVTGRGGAHTAAVLNQIREGALLPYRIAESEARREVAALPEAARKAGAQPGWVRGEEVQADRKISLRETERQINNGDAPLPARERDDRGTGSK